MEVGKGSLVARVVLVLGGLDVDAAHLARGVVYWKIAGQARGRTNRTGMRETLARIQAVVEADRAPTPTGGD